MTLDGAPIDGVTLDLRFYDGSDWWTTASTTNTDAEGYYAFHSTPSLGPGQKYYVLYRNVARAQSVAYGFGVPGRWILSPLASG